jgi:hypothetical protein
MLRPSRTTDPPFLQHTAIVHDLRTRQSSFQAILPRHCPASASAEEMRRMRSCLCSLAVSHLVVTITTRVYSPMLVWPILDFLHRTSEAKPEPALPTETAPAPTATVPCASTHIECSRTCAPATATATTRGCPLLPLLLLPPPLLDHRQQLQPAMGSSLFNSLRSPRQLRPRTPRRFRIHHNPRLRLALRTRRPHPLLSPSVSPAPLRLYRTSNPHSLAKHNPGSAPWVSNHNPLTDLATPTSNPTARTISINRSSHSRNPSPTHSRMKPSTFPDSAEASGVLAIKVHNRRPSVIRSRRFMGSKHRSTIQVMALVILVLEDLRHLDTNPRAALAVQGLVATLVVTMGNG